MSHVVRCGGCSQAGLAPLTGAALPSEVVAAYLKLLDVQIPDTPPDIELLNKLQLAHIDRVCYENIDMQLPQPVRASIQHECSARRLVQDGRGGYCFFLVGAYSALLYSLGFECSLHTACCAEDPPPEHKWGNHVVCVVHLQDRLWVSDVGLGDGPRLPFPLEDHSFTQECGSYSMRDQGSGVWRWTHDPSGSFAGFSLDMSSSARNMLEFNEFHGWMCESPDSAYISGGLTIQKRTGEGALELRSCTLQLVKPGEEGGKHVLEMIDNYDRWIEVMDLMFGLKLHTILKEDLLALWSKAQRDQQLWEQTQQIKFKTPLDKLD